MSGIIASTAAAAVSMIGRKRRTVASTIASQARRRRDVVVDLVDEDHGVAHDHAGERDRAEHATKPNGTLKTSSAAATPMNPSGAVSSTSSARREKLCSCSMSAVTITMIITGATTAIDFCALAGVLDGAARVDAVARRQLRADRLERRVHLLAHHRRLDAVLQVGAHRDRRQAVAAPVDALLEAVGDVGDLRERHGAPAARSAPRGPSGGS